MSTTQFANSIRGYTRIPRFDALDSQDTTSSSDETAAKEELYDGSVPRRHSRTLQTSWFASVLHACSCLTFLAGLVMIILSRTRHPSDSECIKKMTIWSPLVDVAEMEEVTFQNELRHQTEFRGPPTPEIEQAWKRLSHFAGVDIPVEKLPLYKRPQGIEWQLTPAEQGGGFFAGVEVFHQLHCLNVIRKFTWYDHYQGIPIGFTNETEDVRTHIDHCLETLRLSLMCNADLTPYFMQRDPSLPLGGQNDFNVHHKCKKWDILTDWMHSNAVNGDLLVLDLPRPVYTIKSDKAETVIMGG